jgi:YfiR/HmsC-like
MELDNPGVQRQAKPPKLLVERFMFYLCFSASSLALFLHLGTVSLFAQEPKPTADQVQAAYLYNFGKFVKWPAVAQANQNGAFTICVIGEDPFAAVLQSRLAAESVGGKPVSVKRLSKAQGFAVCHILFIGEAEKKDLGGILASIDDASVLTVSDLPDFTKRGGMIQFLLEGDRVRFEINLESAGKSHLVMASDLLNVAVAVKKPSSSGD